MLSTTLKYSLLSLCLAGAATAATLPPYHTVIDSAKSEGKYQIVIWAGTDWSAPSRAVVRTAEELTAPKGSIICLQDERNNISEEEAKLPKPPGAIWNIPAIEVVTPEGQLVYKQEGIDADSLPADLKETQDAIARQEKANALFKEAEGATGPHAADLFAKGLQLLPPYAAKERKDILDKIKKQDPDDKSGALTRAAFNHLSYIEKVQRIVEDSKKKTGTPDYRTAHQYVAAQLRSPGLSALQKQQIMAGYFWLFRSEGKKDAALRTLADIVKVDPKSVMGVGARNYIDFLKKPVTLDGPHIGSRDLRPDMTPTHLKLTKDMVNGGGTYKVTFQFTSGNCDIQNPRLIAGPRVIASANGQKGREFTLTVPASSTPTELVFDCKGSGWFDAACDIIITKQ